MTLKVTAPVVLGPATLVATDVPEADHDEWSVVTTYALGARVIRAHAVWESAQASNLAHDPATSGDAWWLRVSATNRWRGFELEQVTWTAKADSFYYEFTPGLINAVHIIGLRDAGSVRVRLTDPAAGLVYDSENQAVGRVMDGVGWWAWGYGTRRVVDQVHLYELPSYSAATLRLDFAGGADLGVRAVLAGTVRAFGVGVQYGARLGIDSYSKVARDKWGTATLQKGNYSKRVSFNLLVHPSELDALTDFLVAGDALVQLWNIADQWRSTKVLGFAKSWEQTISTAKTVDVSFEINGVAANG